MKYYVYISSPLRLVNAQLLFIRLDAFYIHNNFLQVQSEQLLPLAE